MSLADDLFSQAAQASKAQLADALTVENERLRKENTRMRLALMGLVDDIDQISPELRGVGFHPAVLVIGNLEAAKNALKPKPPEHLEKSP